MSGQRFALVLEAPDKADGIRLLRHALKVLSRRFQLRAITVRELHDTPAQAELLGRRRRPIHCMVCRCGYRSPAAAAASSSRLVPARQCTPPA